MQLAKRFHSDESGQALTEFVLIVPLFVMIYFFAQWSWELIQVKLKVQEAARYAAWEATSYPLHDYAKDKFDGTSSMRTSVMASTALRYTYLDSSSHLLQSMPHAPQLLFASWTPPVALIENQSEEMFYGGPFFNSVMSLGLDLGALITGYLYTNQNIVAQSLITSSKKNAIGKNPGKAMASLFGNDDWGLNKKGYIKATVLVQVTNNWFNVRIGGKRIFGKSGFLIKEEHSVMADSWRMNKKGTEAWADDNKNVPGYSSGVMSKQVAKMYLMTDTTRKVAKGIAAEIYSTLVGSSIGVMTKVPSLNDMVRSSVVMKPYSNASLGSGQVELKEDKWSLEYDSVPTIDKYGETLKDRGNHFMGCPESNKLGCTHTLTQDNPFGDYLLREE